ncbi:MAG: patatin family protein [Butyrivibrio sp.]|nr:patatin family protein [Butyrivibrio sp.]
MAKTGLVLEGGAFRGVFTAGVLDVLMENKIECDYVVGVSAGAGNAMGYLSKQQGRTRNVIKPKDHRQNYFGIKHILRHGRFLNLDMMFLEYPYNQFPYDFDEFFRCRTENEVVVTNCETGKAEYYDERRNIEKLLNLCKASCSVPIMCAPVKIDDYHYLDGSICDSIPIERARAKGCDRLIVVMTKNSKETPTDYGRLKALLKMRYKRKYPRFYEALLRRTSVYKKQLNQLEQLEREGSALVLRPDMECIHKFEQKDERVEAFYQNGRSVAERNLDRIAEFISGAGGTLKVSGGRE